MKVVVTGKQIDVGDALRGHVEERLEALVNKYFNHSIDSQVTFSREAHLLRADCSVHIGQSIHVQSQADATEIYAAFDASADRLEKRLRRYKRRLNNHHKVKRNDDLLPATSYVLAAEEEQEEEPEHLQPIVIAEMEVDIPEATVGEAVMRMDLADVPTLMFRNSAHGGLNVVYRRPDGNIGWIDPRGAKSGSSRP